jgi:hypothetical protein
MADSKTRLRADIANNLKEIQDTIRSETEIWIHNEKSIAFKNLMSLDIETLITWDVIAGQIKNTEDLKVNTLSIIRRYEKLKEVESCISGAFKDRPRKYIPTPDSTERRLMFEGMYSRLLNDIRQLGVMMMTKEVVE